MHHNLASLSLFEHAWNEFSQRQYGHSERLHEAIRYTLQGRGKRVRAVSAMMVAEQYGKSARAALSAGCAAEMIHAYSLVHDDLPCLDNDDWRRGRPSVHKAFDEATALLVGDALLTDAFRVLCDRDFFPDNQGVSASDQIKQVQILSKAAGGQGMVLGQARDMWWTGRSDISEEALQSIHLEKTGALMGASFALGAAAVNASDQDISAWDKFGRTIGLVFQAVDDCLDQSQNTGKSPGKDLDQGKLTYLRFQSRDDIWNWTAKTTRAALAQLPLEPSVEFSRFITDLTGRKT